MEHDRRPVVCHRRRELILEHDVAQNRREIDCGEAVPQLAFELEHSGLETVEEHQPGCAVRRELAAQLGADRPGGAGDEHRAVGDQRAHLGQVESHGLAREEIVHLDVAHLGIHHTALGQLAE